MKFLVSRSRTCFLAKINIFWFSSIRCQIFNARICNVYLCSDIEQIVSNRSEANLFINTKEETCNKIFALAVASTPTFTCE